MLSTTTRRIARAAGLAACLAIWARAETVDFEGPAYAADKTIAGVDGWVASASELQAAQDNFRIQAGAAGQGRWAHVQTATTASVYRAFGNGAAAATLIDVRWRWRGLSDSVRFCVGAAAAAGTARLASRALACLEPSGAITAQGAQIAPQATEESWKPGQWLYMRLALDNAGGLAGTFTLYVADDSLRTGERAAASGPMGGSGTPARLVLRDENGSGFADVDDISWEPVALWQPAADGDTLWGSAGNWSTGAPPDSDSRVRFSAAALRGCLLDRDATVRAVEVAEGFPGALDLGAHTLSVLGDADFTGGAAASGAGRIRFPSAHPSSLSGPAGALPLPPVIHDGPGLLRLDGRALSVSGLTQSGGVFDFHGFDLVVAGAWQVKAGRPGTLRNLDGRSVIATGGARLEGVARDTALGLATSPKGWTLNASGADSLIARYAQLGNARATGKAGIAILSADAGGNQGWTFLNVPAFMAQPRDTALRTGDTAVFRVSLAAPQSAAYQWLRDDVAIPGAADSIYVLKGARKADSGAVFTCKASNPAGYAYSAPSHLKVSFPAPASDPPPAPFADSVRVRLIPSAPAAQTWFSRNGGAWTPYAAPLLLADSTVLRAYSVLLGDTSATATLAFPRALPPILPAPAIQPEGGTFAGSLTVTLVPPLAGARLYYTLDGSDPDSAAEAYAGPFTLAATATVRAIAYLQGYRPSPVAMRVYVRKGDTALPPPAAAPPGGTFADSAVVRVSPPPGFPDAALYCRLLPAAADSSAPAPVPFRCPDSLVIRAGATLEALAVSGSRASDTARWDFVRRLGSPSVTPKGRIFHDTLRIRASASAPGESVRYTLDGSDPGPASPLFPAGGILLDSSAEVRAASALGSGLGPVVSETYTLIPDTPEVSPRGGDYSSPIRVTLSSRTPRASIYYTLDGTAPGPDRGLPPYSGPFDLDTNATLKAVAVVGAGGRARSGALRIENYAFILTGNRTLQPGRRLALSGNYSLGSPADAATEVSVEVLAADSVSAGLRGFRGVLFGLRLSLPLGAAGFPPLTLACPAGEPRALYRLAAPGIVRWVASAGGGPIDAAGTYFLAEDTLAPTVRYSGESFTSEDSTRLVVTIEDNVQNLGLDLERSDDPGRSFAGHEVNPVLILAVNAKNPPGDLRPLTVKIKVDDHTRSASFPADGGAYALQQRFPGPVSSPAAYRIGTDPEAPWDLVALPLAADQPLTLAKLRKDNSAPGLQAAVFDPKREAYVFPAADSPLEPGTSFWLAAPASLSALALSGARTVSLKGRTVPGLILHPGWNQVANPTLSPLWWPADRSDSESYQASPVKGLHAWDAVAGGYVHAEVLEPWRGYFAYYHGDRDTAIDLLGAPPSPPADSVLFGSLGKAGAAGPGFRLRLSWSAGGILRLGASPRAADGFGVEDEAGPPARDPASTRLFSARRGLRLETDLERWRPGFVYAWTVVAGLSPRGSGALSAAAEGLPPGYAAWAVSRARGLRFPLSDGSGEASPLPWRPGYADTLDVLAGPAAALESRLAAIPLRPGPFAARTLPQPGGYLLELDLPAAARVSLAVHSFDGRLMERRSLFLPEGRYRLPGGGRWAHGLYILVLSAGGAGPDSGIPARSVLKFAIP